MPKKNTPGDVIALSSVQELRDMAYEEVTDLKNGLTNFERAKAVNTYIKNVLASYRLQLAALKSTGQEIDLDRMPGLIADKE